MNAYQQEQLEALTMVRGHLDILGAATADRLRSLLTEYRSFRSRAADFLETHFQSTCTETCYRSNRSACCSKDGIITFFADIAVNALVSSPEELARMEAAIRHPLNEFKCIYLSENGCVWRIKPIVCEFFLCDEAERKVFGNNSVAREQWEAFQVGKKAYTWPDRPVLFETIESAYIAQGCRSSLMYLHNSPGLLRIRRLRAEKENLPVGYEFSKDAKSACGDRIR